MIYEVFRYMNYGKLSGEIGKDFKECKWKKYYYVKTGVKKYLCVRPGIMKKGDWTNCPPNCRHRRFAEIPKYEKTSILKFMEQMIAVIASLFAIYKICAEIYDRYMGCIVLLISSI